MRTMPGLEIDDSDFPVLKPGIYRFKVVEAEEAESKKGNPMIKVAMDVIDPERSRVARVWDYLVGSESMEWKTRHFAKATGLMKQYETGNLSAFDLTQVDGKCKLVIEESDKYGKSNKVQDYIPVETDVTEQSPVATGANPSPLEDDIPF